MLQKRDYFLWYIHVRINHSIPILCIYITRDGWFILYVAVYIVTSVIIFYLISLTPQILDIVLPLNVLYYCLMKRTTLSMTLLLHSFSRYCVFINTLSRTSRTRLSDRDLHWACLQRFRNSWVITIFLTIFLYNKI